MTTLITEEEQESLARLRAVEQMNESLTAEDRQQRLEEIYGGPFTPADAQPASA